MTALFFNEFRQNRRPLIIWSVIVLVTAAFGGVEFIGLQSNIDVMVIAVSGMPRIVRIVFGIDAIPLNTPLGQYVCMYFWSAIVAFCYAAYLGVFVIAKDEHFHTAEFIYTKPFKRSQIVTAKLLVAAVNIAVIAIVSAVGAIVFLLPVIGAMDLLPEVISTTAGMFLTQIIFAAIGALCAALTATYQKGLLWSFVVLIASYMTAFAIEYAGTADFLSFISLVRYFNAPAVAENGLGILYIALTALLSAAALCAAFSRYRKRDIHA